MTTYFVDPKHGSDKKGDGMTPGTAFKSWRHAEDIAYINKYGVTKSKLLESFTGSEMDVLKRYFGQDELRSNHETM